MAWKALSATGPFGGVTELAEFLQYPVHMVPLHFNHTVLHRATTAAGGKLSAYRTRIGGTSVTVPTGVGDYRSALGCDMPASK